MQESQPPQVPRIPAVPEVIFIIVILGYLFRDKMFGATKNIYELL